MSPSEILAAGPTLSEEQLRLVHETLQAVLTSHYFHKSKRYPAFLEFVVRAALEENTHSMKERSVGIEVFGRTADYNTGNDPVVRIAAGEVRRRMAVYFSEHPEAPVRIDLPIGSYKAEFHFRDQTTSERSFQESQVQAFLDSSSEQPEEDALPVGLGDTEALSTIPAPSVAPRRWVTVRQVVASAMLLLAVAGIGLWRYQRNRGMQEFWGPVLQNGEQPLILLGKTTTPGPSGVQGGQTESAAYGPGGSKSLVLDDAIAAAKICGIFREYGRDCQMEPGKSAGGDELRNKSLVVVGGLGSAWAQQFLAPLLYHPRSGTIIEPQAKGTVLLMEHRPTGEIPLWKFNRDAPPAQFGKDYAIVARFRSEATGGIAVVVAGLGPQGTNEAGQFVSSPEKLHDLLRRAPRGWKGTNFEAVLQVDLVQGTPSSAEVIASSFW